MNILVLHGPNLNLLGVRPGDERGRTFDALERAIRARADSLKVLVRTALSQSEGGLLEALHRERAWAEAIVVNPTSLARTAWSLREALWALGKPAVEVQLEDGPKGEPSRRESVLREVCVRQIFNEGMDGYLRALEHLAASPREKSIGRGASAPASATPAPAETPRKTLGRRAVTEVEVPSGKSIGPRARTLLETEVPGTFTRELLRRKITDRLAGRISPAELAEWAKGEWQQFQRGGHPVGPAKEELESALQRLLLSNIAPSRMNDEQLLELLTELSS
jgi:3-dehydroquinate dehydratase-2